MQIHFKSANENIMSGINIFLVCDDMKLPASLERHGAMKNFLHQNKAFEGKIASTLSAVLMDSEPRTVLLVGLGNPEKLTRKHLNSAGAAIATKVNGLKAEECNVFVEESLAHLSDKIEENEAAAYLAEGIKLRNYRFNKYYFNKKNDHSIHLNTVNILVKNPTATAKKFEKLGAVAEGVILTRDLVNEPANVIYPESFANKCLELSELGLKVRVLEENEMRKLGMGALLGVAQGSANSPRLVAIEWWGDANGKDVAPLAVVGKGVTFDTGGINLKSSNHIKGMQYDMAGAAVVAGLMKGLALAKSPQNVVGFLGLVENMPSGTAQRPGDIVKSMSGQTIEIDDTDAEGRLVLADVMWFAQTEYKCNTIIDLATLTGAVSVALGDEFAGLFSNNDDLAKDLLAAGKTVNEQLWRLPLSEHYDSRINSEVADVRNTARISGAGATTAAQFLRRFLTSDKNRWAHLDIAGVACTSNGELTNGLKGATGYGVRLLENYINNHYKPV